MKPIIEAGTAVILPVQLTVPREATIGNSSLKVSIFLLYGRKMIIVTIIIK